MHSIYWSSRNIWMHSFEIYGKWLVQTNMDISTQVFNAVMLVWGSLTLAPITMGLRLWKWRRVARFHYVNVYLYVSRREDKGPWTSLGPPIICLPKWTLIPHIKPKACFTSCVHKYPNTTVVCNVLRKLLHIQTCTCTYYIQIWANWPATMGHTPWLLVKND